jgi:SAM-dependent methyltransferase
MKKPYKTGTTPAAGMEGGGASAIPCAVCGGVSFLPALQCEGFSYVRCPLCGLVQINPQPERSSVHERYGSAFGGDYLRYELENEAAFLDLQLKTLSDARFDGEEALFFSLGHRRFLDVGSATGALLEKMRERGWDAEGVEISPPMAGYARSARALSIAETPLEECGFPEKSFAVVHASHLIEHLNRPADFAREVFRILIPGGLFLVTTPNIAGLQARLKGGRWRSAIYDHLYLFSVQTLSALLAKAGFKVEQIVTWGGIPKGLAPFPVKRAADFLAKRCGAGDVMMLKARAERRYR